MQFLILYTSGDLIIVLDKKLVDGIETYFKTNVTGKRHNKGGWKTILYVHFHLKNIFKLLVRLFFVVLVADQIIVAIAFYRLVVLVTIYSILSST